ncbi:MAG: DUF3649 domain-containing protein [Comamonas sp.]|uniref:DUF3649 domain-containing protein n=1 Tax=Comamonas sp. TaxID=34028 RepID=UPI002FC8709C
MTKIAIPRQGRALPVVSRVLAAVFGGYLLASAWSVFAGAVFPGGAEAVLAGVQLSFALYVAAVIWAFSPVPPGRVWAGLLLPAAALAALAALLPRWGA